MPRGRVSRAGRAVSDDGDWPDDNNYVDDLRDERDEAIALLREFDAQWLAFVRDNPQLQDGDGVLIEDPFALKVRAFLGEIDRAGLGEDIGRGTPDGARRHRFDRDTIGLIRCGQRLGDLVVTRIDRVANTVDVMKLDAATGFFGSFPT